MYVCLAILSSIESHIQNYTNLIWISALNFLEKSKVFYLMIFLCFLQCNKAKKKNCYVAISRPTVKCEKTGSAFFFLLFLKMSDLGEEFAKICIQWPKKALVYAF